MSNCSKISIQPDEAVQVHLPVIVRVLDKHSYLGILHEIRLPLVTNNNIVHAIITESFKHDKIVLLKLDRDPSTVDVTEAIALDVSLSLHQHLRLQLHSLRRAVMGKVSKRKKSAPTKKDAKWAVTNKIFSPESELVGMNLMSYFAEPTAWSCLSEDEKTTLRGLFPKTMKYDDNGAPTYTFLRFDMTWRDAIRVFQQEVAAGQQTQQWQDAAALAMEERSAGKFDKWKRQQREEIWGTDTSMPVNCDDENVAHDGKKKLD